MKKLLLILTFLIFSAASFASVSMMPVLNQLDSQGWELWDLGPADVNFHSLSVNEDMTRAVILKSTTHWNKEFKPNQWYDIPQGSAFFLEKEKIAVYILDFKKRPIENHVKSSLLEILHTSVKVTTMPKPRFSFSLFASAYANECAVTGASSTDGMVSFSKRFIAATAPFLNSSFMFQKLKQCGGKAVKSAIDDFLKMVTDPLGFIEGAWKALGTIIGVFADIKNLMPKLIENFVHMDPVKIFDEICPIVARITAGALLSAAGGTKLVLDGVKLLAEFVSKLQLVKKVVSTSRRVIAKLPPPPKIPTLKVANGRALEGTKKIQSESLVKYVDGEMQIGGKALEPSTRYSGVILKDGRKLAGTKNHNQYIMKGDEVGTAFEFWTNKAGKPMMKLNQSSTFKPAYKDMVEFEKWWLKGQVKNGNINSALLNDGLHIRSAAFPN